MTTAPTWNTTTGSGNLRFYLSVGNSTTALDHGIYFSTGGATNSGMAYGLFDNATGSMVYTNAGYVAHGWGAFDVNEFVLMLNSTGCALFDDNSLVFSFQPSDEPEQYNYMALQGLVSTNAAVTSGLITFTVSPSTSGSLAIVLPTLMAVVVMSVLIGSIAVIKRR